METIHNAILFIDIDTMPGTAMVIHQLRRHILRSFLVMK